MHKEDELLEAIEGLRTAIMNKQDMLPSTFSELVTDQTHKFERVEHKIDDLAEKVDSLFNGLSTVQKRLDPIAETYNHATWLGKSFKVLLVFTVTFGGAWAALRALFN